jgi:hypothetical protein
MGCAAFLICALLPPLRRFALGTSLWFVACFPCLLTVVASVVAISLGITGLKTLFHRSQIVGMNPDIPPWAGLLIAVITATITFGGATVITLLHGVLIRRFTLALFRLYLAGVSFCVGVLTVFFISLAFGLGNKLSLFVGTNFLGIIPAAFLAHACYQRARQFRGDYPQQFPVISREEFG